MFVLFSSDLYLVFYRKQNKAEFTFSFCFVLMYKLKVGLFLGPEHEIMVFIAPPIYKFVHKQNIGDFLFIVVLLNQRKKTSFYQISVLSILLFLKKLTDIIELSKYICTSYMLCYFTKKMMRGRKLTEQASCQ